MIEEKNVKKLWQVCEILKDFCDTHNDCNYCPFHDYWDHCAIKHATDLNASELDTLFPEEIVYGDGEA